MSMHPGFQPPTLFDDVNDLGDPIPVRFRDELAEARFDQARSRKIALAAEDVTDWAALAGAELDRIAARGLPFIVDDLLEVVGTPRAKGVNANNSVGALFAKARIEGRIVTTGRRLPSRRREAKGRYVAEWIICGADVAPSASLGA